MCTHLLSRACVKQMAELVAVVSFGFTSQKTKLIVVQVTGGVRNTFQRVGHMHNLQTNEEFINVRIHLKAEECKKELTDTYLDEWKK